MPRYDLNIRRNLGEPNLPLSLVLPYVPKDTTTDSVEAEILWRWEDEPDMKPESLGKTTAGSELTVPFDMKGRTIRLFVNSLTEGGTPSFASVADTVQIIFGEPTVASLVSAVFDPTPDEVELTIDNNGGLGDINILRRLGAGDFSVIASVSSSTPTYVDEPTVDGDYEYKLTQDLLSGESATVPVTVSVGASGTGTAPTSLTATESLSIAGTNPIPDEWDVTLAWTAGSGAGTYTIERKMNAGAWVAITTSEVASPYVDSAVQSQSGGRNYAYRVKQNDVTGYSNEDFVYIPRHSWL